MEEGSPLLKCPLLSFVCAQNISAARGGGRKRGRRQRERLDPLVGSVQELCALGKDGHYRYERQQLSYYSTGGKSAQK